MELQHSFLVPVPPDVAWRTLNDVERIAPCFPGAALTSAEGDEFAGTVKVKLGPVSMQYAGKGRFLERDEAAGVARIEASGKDKRGNGTAAAEVTARLVAEGDATRVVVDTELKVTGRPAQFGRGVIQDVGSKLVDAFAACLAETIRTDQGSDAPRPQDSLGAGEVGTQGDEVGEEREAVGTPSDAAVAPAAAPPPPAATPPAPTPPTRPTPLAPSPSGGSATNELDLGSVVGPVLLRQYGPTLLACVLTAVVTWLVARRRR